MLGLLMFVAPHKKKTCTKWTMANMIIIIIIIAIYLDVLCREDHSSIFSGLLKAKMRKWGDSTPCHHVGVQPRIIDG